ncbi:MAG: oxidoreductase [Bacteroidota bacterium]
MRLIKIFSILFILTTAFDGHAQTAQINTLVSGNKVSIRGLSVVNNQLIWASGNNGNVARSVDGGKNFDWIKVIGYEKRDFRDIEAFDENTAIIMGVDAPAIILKTIDGGKSWKKVLDDSTKGMFLDAMDFSDINNGVVIGDPIDQRVYLSKTSDQGNTWKRLESNDYANKDGEAFFASSGTNIKLIGKQVAFVSGGKSSRLFYSNKWYDIPLLQGKESTGGNSIAVNHGDAVVVGGDFSKDTITAGNCVLINLGKDLIFTQPQTAPHGYRSCVIYLSKNVLVACGTSGVDLSKDGGKNWELISKESFHVVQKAKKGESVYLAGSNGRIAKLID